MDSLPNRQWQFSLAALFVLVTAAALLCAMAGLIGYAVVIGNALVQGLFWLTHKALTSAQENDDRRRNANQCG